MSTPARKFGTPCKLYVDGIPTLQAGEFLRTEAGSVYLVVAVKRSGHLNRRNLECIRWDPADVDADATVHLFRWYPRTARRKR